MDLNFTVIDDVNCEGFLLVICERLLAALTRFKVDANGCFYSSERCRGRCKDVKNIRTGYLRINSAMGTE